MQQLRDEKKKMLNTRILRITDCGFNAKNPYEKVDGGVLKLSSSGYMFHRTHIITYTYTNKNLSYKYMYICGT